MIGFLLQSGPIAPSSLGLWAVTFLLGGLVVIVAWLVRRHYAYTVPAYRRIFGVKNDATANGFLEDSEDRFEQMSKDHEELCDKVSSVIDETESLSESQEIILRNQEQIAEKLDVELVDESSLYKSDD